LGILTINAIRSAGEIIVPVEASRFSLAGLSQLNDIISLIRDRLNHNVTQRVLVTNFDSRLQHSFKILSQIRSDFKNSLFSNIIHVNVKLKEAQSQGTHVLNYDKYCRGTKDYFSLAREIITQEGPGVQKPRVSQNLPELQKQLKETLKKEIPKLNEISFSVTAPQAKEVFLAADFNGWKIDENSKMQFDGGRWTKKIRLTPGSYRYRFVVDGKWNEDPDNPRKEKNPFGEMDSLIEISHQEK
jgi:hypothetical protein